LQGCLLDRDSVHAESPQPLIVTRGPTARVGREADRPGARRDALGSAKGELASNLGARHGCRVPIADRRILPIRPGAPRLWLIDAKPLGVQPKRVDGAVEFTTERAQAFTSREVGAQQVVLLRRVGARGRPEADHSPLATADLPDRATQVFGQRRRRDSLARGQLEQRVLLGRPRQRSTARWDAERSSTNHDGVVRSSEAYRDLRDGQPEPATCDEARDPPSDSSVQPRSRAPVVRTPPGGAVRHAGTGRGSDQPGRTARASWAGHVADCGRANSTRSRSAW
jgi:hypothetical protein